MLIHLRPTRLPMVVLAISLSSVVALGSSATAIADAVADAPSRRADTHHLIRGAVSRGEISEAEGALYLAYAFTATERVPAPYASTTPWDGTLPLLELKATLADLPAGPVVARARSLLRGPSFTCPNYSAKKPNTKATKHFYVQYTNSALQGLTIDQYTNALERTWQAEISDFGWAKPPKDPIRYPKRGRYPVRIESLGAGLYGYVTGTHIAGNNPATPWNDRDAVASCMVLNRSYNGFPSSPHDSLTATVAHEFNHSIQFGYGALTGPGHAANVYVEGGATWMEDEVFDGSNDNWNYLWPDFDTPMPLFDPRFPYPYWVVFRAMSEQVGASGQEGAGEDVMQHFWEQVSRRASTDSAALNRAFKMEDSSLARAYHDASIALRFLQDCDATAAPYCLEEGPDYPTAGAPDDMFTLGANESRTRKIADDYALHWVGLPDNGDIDLSVDPKGGNAKLKVSVACLAGDVVTVQPVGTASGPPIVFEGYDSSGCDEASVVISNVKQTSASPKQVTKTTYEIGLS